MLNSLLGIARKLGDVSRGSTNNEIPEEYKGHYVGVLGDCYYDKRFVMETSIPAEGWSGIKSSLCQITDEYHDVIGTYDMAYMHLGNVQLSRTLTAKQVIDKGLTKSVIVPNLVGYDIDSLQTIIRACDKNTQSVIRNKYLVREAPIVINLGSRNGLQGNRYDGPSPQAQQALINNVNYYGTYPLDYSGWGQYVVNSNVGFNCDALSPIQKIVLPEYNPNVLAILKKRYDSIVVVDVHSSESICNKSSSWAEQLQTKFTRGSLQVLSDYPDMINAIFRVDFSQAANFMGIIGNVGYVYAVDYEALAYILPAVNYPNSCILTMCRGVIDYSNIDVALCDYYM